MVDGIIMSWGTVVASTMACILAILLVFSCFQYHMLSSEYASLYSRCHDLKNEYEKLRGEYQETVSRLKEVSEENSKLRENYSRLVEDYEDLRLRYEDLQEKYHDLMSRYSEVKVSLPRIKEGLEEISDRILTPSDKIPEMLKQARPRMVREVVYGELGLRPETPSSTKAKKILEWIMLNLQYLDDDFHQYLIDGRVASLQDFLSLPNETLARRGGDCEDLAVLTYAMLKSILGDGEQVYIVQICSGGRCHVGVIYRVGDEVMVLDPAGSYVTDARISLEMSVRKGLREYKVWLSPLMIGLEGKKFLIKNGFANLVYMKSPGVEGEAYKFLEVDDAVALWLNHWRREMVNPSIRMVANDTFVKVFTSTQEFLDWMEKPA